MYISDSEYGRLIDLLSRIRNEAFKPAQQRNKMQNLSDKAVLVLKKIKRRSESTLNF